MVLPVDLSIDGGPSTSRKRKRLQPDVMDSHTSSSLSPSGDRETAADAMLKLSASLPQQAPHTALLDNREIKLESPDITDSENDSVSRLSFGDMASSASSRKQREFIPEFKKDQQYWMKRRKNNDAAKRSREKRRLNDLAMSQTIMELTNHNSKLQTELEAIKKRFGLPLNEQFVDNCDSQGHIETSASSDATGSQVTCSSITSGITIATSRSNHDTIATSLSSTMTHIPPVIPASVAQQLLPPTHDPHGIHYLKHPLNVQVPVSAMPVLLSSQPAVRSNVMPHIVTTGLSPTGPTTSHVRAEYPHPIAFCVNDNSTLVTSSTHVAPTGGHAVYSRSGFMPDRYNRENESPGSRSSSPNSLRIALSSPSSNSEYSDQSDNIVLPERDLMPLNLSRRLDSESVALGGTSTSEMMLLQATSIPIKLRHKLGSTDRFRAESGARKRGAPAGDTQNTEITDKAGSEPDDRSHSETDMPFRFDRKYTEKRRRNNMAARKCRENRRLINEIRMAKSNLLENENDRLKDELEGLSVEVTQLRELMEKKRQAEEKGETFHPPNIPTASKQRSRDN